MGRVNTEKIADRERWLSAAPLTKEEIDRGLACCIAQIDANMDAFGVKFPWSATKGLEYPIIENIEWTDGFWTGLLWLAWYIIVLFRFFHRVRKRSKRITWDTVLTLLISLAYFPLHTLFIPMIVFTFVAMMSSRVPLFRYAPRPSGWLLKPMPETVGPHAPTHAKCGSETPVSHAAATRK